MLSEIIPGKLWQSGSLDTPFDEMEVWRRGIRYVVNLCGDDPIRHVPSDLQPFTEVRWEFDDDHVLPDEAALAAVADRTAAAVRAGTRVLVHCAAGLNRSSLVTALVLARLTPMRGPELVEYIRARRSPDCLFNRTFAGYVEKIP